MPSSSLQKKSTWWTCLDHLHWLGKRWEWGKLVWCTFVKYSLGYCCAVCKYCNVIGCFLLLTVCTVPGLEREDLWSRNWGGSSGCPESCKRRTCETIHVSTEIHWQWIRRISPFAVPNYLNQVQHFAGRNLIPKHETAKLGCLFANQSITVSLAFDCIGGIMGFP